MLLLYGTKRCKQYNDMHLQGSKGRSRGTVRGSLDGNEIDSVWPVRGCN